MIRALGIGWSLLAIAALAGCKSNPTTDTLNPWAKSTIPPPPTYTMQVPPGSAPQLAANPQLSSTPNPGVGGNPATAGNLAYNPAATSGVSPYPSINPMAVNQTVPNTSVAGSPVPVPNASTQNPLYPPLAVAPNYPGYAAATTSNYQVASSSVYGTGTGTNRVVNNDYNTTPYNDQSDPTRVGLSDASQMRPPTSAGMYSNDPRYAQSTVPGVYAPGYGTAPAKPSMQGQNVVQGQFNGSAPVGTGYAQATPNPVAPNPASDPNRQAGWQDASNYNR
jgi:hypothetical protein